MQLQKIFDPNVALVWRDAKYCNALMMILPRCHTPEKHYATALKPDLKPNLTSVVPSYDRRSLADFVVPLYNCTTVVKLKMPITLATDMLQTYILHF